MEKLIIELSASSQYIITGNYISIELSNKQTKSPAGLYAIEPQRLIFKFYSAEYPALLVEGEKEARYYEDATDSSPTFWGYATGKAEGDDIEASITFYDLSCKINDASEIVISADQGNGEYALLTKTFQGWFNHIADLALEQNEEDIPLYTGFINPLATGLSGYFQIASFHAAISQDVEFKFAQNLAWIFSSPVINHFASVHEIWFKYKQNDQGQIFLIAAYHGHNYFYNDSPVEFYRVGIFEIFNTVDSLLVYSASQSGLGGWDAWVDNHPEYTHNWQNMISLTPGSIYYWSELKPIGSNVVYHTFPQNIYPENIDYAGSAYHGPMLLDSLTLKLENNRTPDWPDYSLTIKFKTIFENLLKLMDGVVASDHPTNKGLIMIFSRLYLELGTINILSSETEERPPETNVDIKSDIEISDIFLSENHPAREGLNNYFNTLNERIKFQKEYNYFGAEKIYLGYKLTIDRVDLNRVIVGVHPYNLEKQKYKHIITWKIENE